MNYIYEVLVQFRWSDVVVGNVARPVPAKPFFRRARPATVSRTLDRDLVSYFHYCWRDGMPAANREQETGNREQELGLVILSLFCEGSSRLEG